VIRGTRVPVYDVAASFAADIPMDRILAASTSTPTRWSWPVIYAEANPPRGRPKQSAKLPESSVVITDRHLSRRQKSE